MSPVLPDRFEGPALLDLQLNGYGGFDFNSGQESWTVQDLVGVRDGLARRGIGAALPTIITGPPERMLALVRRYSELLAEEPELSIAFPRLHIEGPFISPEEGPRGAHPESWCTTPVAHPDFLERLREASGDRIGILTLAPELQGSLDLIREAAAAAICPSLGHTVATPEEIADAVGAGARMCTHLGNGSHQLLPRLANYIQAQLAEDRLAASFIADGHHIPWYTLKNFLRAKTPTRSVLVSDATAAADAGPGEYRLGDSAIEATANGRVQVPNQVSLAGSALTLDRAVLSVVAHCDVPFVEAWSMASTAPAALIGLPPCPSVRVEISEQGFQRSDGPVWIAAGTGQG